MEKIKFSYLRLSVFMTFLILLGAAVCFLLLSIELKILIGSLFLIFLISCPLVLFLFWLVNKNPKEGFFISANGIKYLKTIGQSQEINWVEIKNYSLIRKNFYLESLVFETHNNKLEYEIIYLNKKSALALIDKYCPENKLKG